MTSVLDVLKLVATGIGLPVPDQVFGSTERVWIEMQALVNRAASMIRDEYEWQAIERTAAIAGDGTAQEFALPAGYNRMPNSSKVWASIRPNWPADKVGTAADWLELTARNLPSSYGQWAIFGNRFHYRPTLPSGGTINFIYLTDRVVQPLSGAEKSTFTADDDTFLLSGRLLELALIYLWKSAKGQAYDASLDDYESALIKAMDVDRGAKAKLQGNGERLMSVKLAFPYSVSDA